MCKFSQNFRPVTSSNYFQNFWLCISSNYFQNTGKIYPEIFLKSYFLEFFSLFLKIPSEFWNTSKFPQNYRISFSSNQCQNFGKIWPQINSNCPQDSTLPKIRFTLKNALSKSCWALNSVQKSHWAYMSVSPRSGAKGLQRLPSWKYYYVQKRENRFTLGLDTVKTTQYIQNCFK